MTFVTILITYLVGFILCATGLLFFHGDIDWNNDEDLEAVAFFLGISLFWPVLFIVGAFLGTGLLLSYGLSRLARKLSDR